MIMDGGSVLSGPPDLGTTHITRDTVSTIHSEFCYLLEDDV